MASDTSYILDRPATEDTLGRLHFAEALSRSLLLPKDSPGLVVGIEGSWGSGKSTLIGFVVRKLGEIKGDSAPIVVEFNPWMVSGTGALVEAMIGQIAASIGKDISAGEKGVKTGQKLLNYVGAIKYLKYLKYVPAVSWAGHIAEGISDITQTVATTAEECVDAGQKALDDVKKFLPSLDLEKKRDEVVVAVTELDRPIVVVIDDIDRLPPKEIRAMVQSIKAVADFPRITYLIAYERSVVARALAADEKSGLSYLEKIVQVAYPIPPLSPQKLKKFANDYAEALLFRLCITLREYEQSRYDEAITLLTRLSRHPRDVVRVINRLTLSLSATHGEVNAADVIVFEALSHRFPVLREAMNRHSKDFTGHFFRGDLIDENDAFAWGFGRPRNADEEQQAWLKHLPQDKDEQRIAEKACLFLFPGQAKNGDRFIYEDHLRIADPDRLQRLFSMTSLEDVPEVKEIHALLSDAKKLEDELSTEDDEQLLRLLEWMANYIPSNPNTNVTACIEKLTETSQALMAHGRLTCEIARRFADVMKRLLQLKVPECNASFLSIAKNAPLSIAEQPILQAAMDQGKWKKRPDSKKNEERQLIADENLVDQAMQIWSDRVRECIAQGTLHKEVCLHSVLHRFAQFESAYAEVYAAVSIMCETDEGLASFLRAYKGEKSISQENISHFVLIDDPEKLTQRIADSVLQDEYLWLFNSLSNEQMILAVKEQADRLKKSVG